MQQRNCRKNEAKDTPSWVFNGFNIENIPKRMVFESFFVSLQQNCSEHEENGINAFDPYNHFHGGLPRE